MEIKLQNNNRMQFKGGSVDDDGIATRIMVYGLRKSYKMFINTTEHRNVEKVISRRERNLLFRKACKLYALRDKLNQEKNRKEIANSLKF